MDKRPDADFAAPLLIDLTERGGVVVIPLRVKTRARLTGITGRVAGRLKVSIPAVPEKGNANRAICTYFAKLMSVAKSRVTILSGKTSTQKTIAIAGRSLKDVQERLRVCIVNKINATKM